MGREKGAVPSAPRNATGIAPKHHTEKVTAESQMQKHHRPSYNHHRHHNLSIGCPLKLQCYHIIPSHPSIHKKEAYCFFHQHLSFPANLIKTSTHPSNREHIINIFHQHLRLDSTNHINTSRRQFILPPPFPQFASALVLGVNVLSSNSVCALG